MSLHNRYPALSDLRRRARARLPKFVWEYLDSGTGDERTKAHNRAALDRIRFLPSILHGEFTPDISAPLMGHRFPLPLGIAPVGMSGLFWPGAEASLARAASRLGLPYCLSSVASQSPEDMAPHLGDNAWFQLYPPRDEEIRRDMLARVREAGFKGLILTVDVPVASRRERQTRSGLTNPPRLTPRLLAQVALRPAWAAGMARRGMPTMRTLEKYADTSGTARSATEHVGYLMRTSPDWSYLHWLRENWDGPLIVKGVMRAGDAAGLAAAGVDAIWISNHAGRQFDAAPATIEVLPDIRAATNLPIIIDSGFETGLDILRAFSMGANFVMMGRPWHMALAALGEDGPDHLAEILQKDLIANMGQMGARDLYALPAPLGHGRAL